MSTSFDFEAHPEAIQVEAGIFDLVYALNQIRNTRTLASCQGHQYVDIHTPAFVVFKCSFEIAIQIARIVRNHRGFYIQISYEKHLSQQVECHIEIFYVEMPPHPGSFSRPLKQIQTEFIADMESAGLLTEEVTQMLIPWCPNESEGIFLPKEFSYPMLRISLMKRFKQQHNLDNVMYIVNTYFLLC